MHRASVFSLSNAVYLLGPLALFSVIACGKSSSSTANDPNNGKNNEACTPITGTYPAGTPDPNTGAMYAKYGDDVFNAVNGNIISHALALDTNQVGDSFQRLVATPEDPSFYDTPSTFTANLLAFLKYVYSGGTQPYHGKNMVAAHAGLNITSAQYDYFINNAVVPSLEVVGLKTTDPDFTSFATPVLDPNFKYQIVTCE